MLILTSTARGWLSSQFKVPAKNNLSGHRIGRLFTLMTNGGDQGCISRICDLQLRAHGYALCEFF